LVPAWLLVVVVIGALPHGDFHGILGVQRHELRLVAFSITGGVGYAWRLGRRRPATWQALTRPLIAAAAAYAICFVAVAVMRLLFIPQQSLGVTLITDSPGRALPVAVVVAAVGYLLEIVRVARRTA
jgi:hypothetical protein